VLLGEHGEELGGSEYLSQIHQIEAGVPPKLDLALEEAVQLACIETIGEGLATSAHDCAEGGLAVALAECCFHPSGGFGAEVALPAPGRADALLFGETQSRILLSLPRTGLGRAEKIFAEREVPYSVLGSVGGSRLKITAGKETLLQVAVADLLKPWNEALPGWML
jgi:phosphoribosylformylglycinamidine synthase